MASTRAAAASPEPLTLVEALLDTEPERALRLLLEHWRSTHEPKLALLVERLGATLSRPLEGLPAKQVDRSLALSTLARDTPAEGRSAVLDALANFVRSAQGKKVWPALDAVLEQPGDPRIAHMALRLLESVEGRGQTGKVLRRLLACVERHGDLGVLPTFEPWSTGPGRGVAEPERLANIVSRLRKRTPTKVDGEALARLLARLPPPLSPSRDKPAVSEEVMLASVVARPDDDAPRMMYADWLTEQQHPRGEFIALQVARAHGRASKEARAREDELLAQHRTLFLGPLADRVALSGLRFERGFLARCTLKNPLPRHQLVKLLSDIEFGGYGAPNDVGLPALETAREVSLELLSELMARSPRLVNASTRKLTGYGAEWTATRELLVRLPRPLARLDFCLQLETEPLSFVLRQAFAVPTLAQLTSLGVTSRRPSALPTRAVLDLAPASLRRLALRLEAAHTELTLAREAMGPWTQAQVTLGWAADGALLWPLLAEAGCVAVKVRTPNAPTVALALEAFPQLNATVGDA